MRKLLLATTALVGTAGIASAEISLSGFAEIGVYSNGKDSATKIASTNYKTSNEAGGEMNFHTDIDATFKMNLQTDNGLSISTAVDIDEASGAATGNDADDGGIAVTVAGDFGSVTVGDTDGGYDWALTETAVGGALKDDHTGHAGYDANSGLDGSIDGQIVRWSYTSGAFGIGVSMEQGTGKRSSNATTGKVEDDPADIIGIGVKYTLGTGAGDVTLGLGMQNGSVVEGTATPTKSNKAKDASMFGMSASMKLGGGLQLIANYSTRTVSYPIGTGMDTADAGTATKAYDITTTHTGLGLGYTVDALTIGFNYGSKSIENAHPASVASITTTTPAGSPLKEISRSGLGATLNYNLGGGATFQLGYGSGSDDDKALNGSGGATWSAGLALSF